MSKKDYNVCVTLSQFCAQDDRPRRLLQEAGFQVAENKMCRRLKAEELYEFLKDADGVIAAVEPYSVDLLSRLPRLRCISRCGAGIDNVDLFAARKYQIAVLATQDEVVEPVVQMTLGMFFALLRNFLPHKFDFSEGLWKKQTGFLLSECTIGLVGFGKIGRKMEEYLRPFNPRVLVYDPYLTRDAIPHTAHWVDWDILLQESDIVSLHASRPLQEGYLVGSKELAKMKKGSFLINTARGYLVDALALETALAKGHLSGAALDVFEEEPYTGNLCRHPQVICTPHVATLTRASRIAMELKSTQNLVNYFNGQS